MVTNRRHLSFIMQDFWFICQEQQREMLFPIDSGVLRNFVVFFLRRTAIISHCGKSSMATWRFHRMENHPPAGKKIEKTNQPSDCHFQFPGDKHLAKSWFRPAAEHTQLGWKEEWPIPFCQLNRATLFVVILLTADNNDGVLLPFQSFLLFQRTHFRRQWLVRSACGRAGGADTIRSLPNEWVSVGLDRVLVSALLVPCWPHPFSAFYSCRPAAFVRITFLFFLAGQSRHLPVDEQRQQIYRLRCVNRIARRPGQLHSYVATLVGCESAATMRDNSSIPYRHAVNTTAHAPSHPIRPSAGNGASLHFL